MDTEMNPETDVAVEVEVESSAKPIDESASSENIILHEESASTESIILHEETASDESVMLLQETASDESVILPQETASADSIVLSQVSALAENIVLPVTDIQNQTYACVLCKTIFKTYYQFYKHRHKGTDCRDSAGSNFRKRICVRCKKSFYNASSFRKHIVSCWRKACDDSALLQNHNGSALQISNNTPSEAVLDNEKPLKPKYVSKRKKAPQKNCPICGIRFKSSSHYTLHLRKKNACRAPPYICGLCNKEFGSVHNLMMHEKRKNSCMWYNLQRQTLVSIPGNNDSPKPLAPANDESMLEEVLKDCLQCGKSFHNLSEFQQHLHTEPYGFKATTNPKTPAAEPKTRSPENSDDEDAFYASCRIPQGFRCKRCFMVFPFLYRFKNHMNRKVPCALPVGPPVTTPSTVSKPSSGVGKPFTTPASGVSKLSSVGLFASGVSNKPTASDIKRSARKTFPPVRFEPDEEADFLNAQFYPEPNSQKKMVSKGKKTALQAFDSKKPTHQVFDSVPVEEKIGAAGSENFICTDCNKSFTSSSAWYKHGKKYHYEEGKDPISCPECNVPFQHKYLLLGHQRKFLHWGQEHGYCPFCQKQFTTFRSRNAHVIKAHKKYQPQDVRDFVFATTCQLCSRKFVDLVSKEHHVKVEHKGVTPLSIPSKSVLLNASGASKGHVCLRCKFSFETVELYTAHIRRCPSKIKKSRPSGLTSLKKNSEGAPIVFNCKDCSMTFTTKHHFSAHQNRFCPKKSHSKTHVMSLKSNKRGRGILSITNGQFGFICSLCKMKFSSRFQYSMHARSSCPMKNKRAGLKLIFRPLALKAKQAETEELQPLQPWQVALKARQRAQEVEKAWQQHRFKVKQKSLDAKAQVAQNQWRLGLKPKPRPQQTQEPWQIALKAQERQPSFEKQWQLAPKANQQPEKTWQPAIKPKPATQTEGKTVVSCKCCEVEFTDFLEYRVHDCDDFRPPVAEVPAAKSVPPKDEEKKKKLKKKFYVKTVNKAQVITSSISHLIKKFPTMCPFCRRRYCNSFVRDRHLKLHTLDRSFACVHCHESFLRSEYLTRHLQAEHHHLLRFECSKCDLRYPSKLHCLQHIKKMHRSVESAKFITEVAGNSSSNSLTQTPQKPVIKRVNKVSPDAVVSKLPNTYSRLPSNILLVAKNAPGKGIFSCELCKVSSFSKMSTLQRHLKSRIHKENMLRRRLRMVKKRKPTESAESKQLVCSVCKQLFTSTRTFVPHRLSHFNTKNAEPTEISELNPYSCEICAREFSHHQRVQAHLLWHLRAIKAPHFSSSFSATAPSLLGLERLSSSGSSQANSPVKEGSAKKSIGGGSPTKQPKIDFNREPLEISPSSLSCNKCGATFSSPRQSKSHDCSSTIVCPFCGLSFSSPRGYSVHKSKWCTKKPLFKFYSCRYCALQFETADDVGWHEKSCRKVHGSEKVSFVPNDPKRFSCKYCSETLVSYNILVIHERDCSNKPATEKSNDGPCHSLQCLTCQQTFYNNEMLEKHTQFHAGEGFRICCLTCDKTLESMDDVYKHIEKQKSSVNSVRDQFEDRSSENLTESIKGDEDSGVYRWSSKPKNIESDGSFEPETFVVHSPKLGKLYQCIHCRKLYRDKYHLKAHLVLHKPFVCKICGEMECTTVGYQSHPCRLPDGSFATGILHRKKWIKSTIVKKPKNLSSSVASTPTSENASCHISDAAEAVVAEPEKEKVELVVVKKEPDVDAPDQEALDSLRDNFSQLLFLLVADPDLMNTLGWGKKLVDLVLDDVLLHLGQQPIDSVKISSDVERLRQNILLFLQLCIKDDVLTSVGGCAKPIETVVTEMLHVCTDGLPENLPNGTNAFTAEAANV